MFLRLFYSSVRNKWPTAYSSVQSALEAQEQERFPKYLLLRVAPVVLVVVFAAVTADRLHASTGIALTATAGIHHLVRRVEDPTVDGLEWEVLGRHTFATHEHARRVISAWVEELSHPASALHPRDAQPHRARASLGCRSAARQDAAW
jgi:hypothetical protein